MLISRSHAVLGHQQGTSVVAVGFSKFAGRADLPAKPLDALMRPGERAELNPIAYLPSKVPDGGKGRRENKSALESCVTVRLSSAFLGLDSWIE